MKKFLILFTSVLILAACGDGSKKEPDNLTEGNAAANSAMQRLHDKIVEAEENRPEKASTGEEIFKKSDYDEIKKDFENALKEDADNPTAHFGLALLEIASINYDEEFWAILKSIKIYDEKSSYDDEDHYRNRIFGNQFGFLKNSIAAYPYYLKRMADSNDNTKMSFARLQKFIETSLLPKTKSSIEHLFNAVNLSEENSIKISNGEEYIEIDRGEILVFKASVHAVSAAAKLLSLYDLNLVDTDGTSDWVEKIKDEEDDEDTKCLDWKVETVDGEKVLKIRSEMGRKDAEKMLELSKVVKYNLEEREGFLELREGKKPADIKKDLLETVNSLESAYDYIMSEKDSQEDDLIKIGHLVDMNENIASDEDKTDFAKEWKSVKDVILWLRSSLDTPFVFEAGNGTEVKVDASKFFSPGISDLKEKLPYFKWLPEKEWMEMVVEDEWENSADYENGSLRTYCGDEFIEIKEEGIERIIYTYYEVKTLPFQLTDESGNADDEIEYPIFPDYTLNGIFPEMTREKFESIID